MIKQIHLSECDSTQDELKEQLKPGNAREEILVSCDHQLKGRGRGDHSWQALPGSVCFSLSIKPHQILSLTALEISVLVARFFEIKKCHLKLKWPNDLWNENYLKCGGILVQGSKEEFMAGVGINLFTTGDFGGVYKEAFEFSARSWSLECAQYISSHRYTDSRELISDWSERCGHLNQKVIIQDGSEILEGLFIGIGAHGEALLQVGVEVKKAYNGSLRVLA